MIINLFIDLLVAIIISITFIGLQVILT